MSTTQGVFREGRFSMCGDGNRGVPECMGRAVCGCEIGVDGPCPHCTCPKFSIEEMRFARENKLTIEGYADLPIEWQGRRGRPILGPQRWEERGTHDRCMFCGVDSHVVRGPEPATICEPCARQVLQLFTERRALVGEPHLRSVEASE